jgi:hypothetical protein
MIQYVRSHPDYLANMRGTAYAWIPGAYRLAPAPFTLFLGVVLMVRRRKWSGAFFEAYLCWAMTFGLLCLFEFGFHNVGLRVHYVGSYMLCPLLVFAGLVIGECFADDRHDPAAVAGNPTRATSPVGGVTAISWAVGILTVALPLLYENGLILASAPAPEIKTVVNSKTTFVHLTLGTDRTRERSQQLQDRGIVAGNERKSIVPSNLGNIYVVLQDVLDDSNLY